MGYDAFVPCNCYKNGKTVPPPFEEYVVIDEDGLIEMVLPDGLRDAGWDICSKYYLPFDRWMMDACEHEDMRYLFERIANISGMSKFRNLLEERGGEPLFPVLSKYLPRSNGGTLPVESAQDAIKELEELVRLPDFRFLIECESEERLYSAAHGEERWIALFDYRYAFFLGEHGFTIGKKDRSGFVEHEEYTILFRGGKFVQKHLEDDAYLFIEKTTGENYTCRKRLYPQTNDLPVQKEYEFEVQDRSTPVSEYFSYAIDPLLLLLHASLEIGNPIHWT